MELFSERYSCYYHVLRHLLCTKHPLTLNEICDRVSNEGFGESLLSIIPNLNSGAWNVFAKKGDLYLSRISPHFVTPLSNLEKAYLKALLQDARIGLFLDQNLKDDLDGMLSSVTPLWKEEQLYYYDRFADGDPYQDETYRKNFHTILSAQKNRTYLNIDYDSSKGTRIHHHYVPARLEYSEKNDKFRLLALKESEHGNMELQVLNIDRIRQISQTQKTLSSAVNINELIKRSYYKEPLTLRIADKRNALERAMLHFANYEKNTVKIDENTYECLIYYNQSMETELLIEVMSFGPMLTVTGNERFLKALKERLKKQISLPSVSCSSGGTCQ